MAQIKSLLLENPIKSLFVLYCTLLLDNNLIVAGRTRRHHPSGFFKGL
ncbi:hypothetical protein OROHE_001760 [Orobanche hederae]